MPKRSSKQKKKKNPTMDSLLEKPRQRQFISLLHQYPDGFADSEICRKMNIKNSMALSGVTTAIIKKAKRHGWERENVFVRTRNKENNDIIFKLSPSFRKLTEEAFKERHERKGL